MELARVIELRFRSEEIRDRKAREDEERKRTQTAGNK